mmetsp:Transcript_29109/g.70197  ORF Transcript_29109/g.70197 Transcript_29109/m.70197 type:complete len:100 (-) Transcript_29109:367-666(-)
MALFWNDLTGDLTETFCRVVVNSNNDGDGESIPPSPVSIAGWAAFNMDCRSFDPSRNSTYGVGRIPEVKCDCCYCCEDNVEDPYSRLYCNSNRPTLRPP